MTDVTATVFVVDDDASIRKSLERLIRSVGLTTQTFISAQEFLESDLPDGPSCLVLDVRMPGLSGFDLLDELQRRDYFQPVIFITGHGDVPMSVRAMKRGAVDFLTKPFNDQELLDAINRALETDRQERQRRLDLMCVRTRLESLTPREEEVFSLVVTGRQNKVIAGDLGMSEKTVKVHRARVMQKMQAESIVDLVRFADMLGVSQE